MALTLHPRTEMRCVPALLARLSSGAPSTIVAVLVQLAVLPATVAAESPLTQETVAAYNAMAARVERRFVAAARRDTPAITSTLRHGEITVEPATGDGILKVPDGLVHHSRGAAFIPGVTLADVLRIARSYDEYSAI